MRSRSLLMPAHPYIIWDVQCTMTIKELKYLSVGYKFHLSAGVVDVIHQEHQLCQWTEPNKMILFCLLLS